MKLLLMYAFGTLFNLLAFFAKGQRPKEWHWTTTMLVVYYAFSGILISFVMKHLGNVARNLIGVITTICVTICSHFLLGNPLTLQFILGGSIVCVGTALYNSQKPVRIHTDEKKYN